MDQFGADNLFTQFKKQSDADEWIDSIWSITTDAQRNAIMRAYFQKTRPSN
jgi:hypothetical protein